MCFPFGLMINHLLDFWICLKRDFIAFIRSSKQFCYEYILVTEILMMSFGIKVHRKRYKCANVERRHYELYLLFSPVAGIMFSLQANFMGWSTFLFYSFQMKGKRDSGNFLCAFPFHFLPFLLPKLFEFIYLFIYLFISCLSEDLRRTVKLLQNQSQY